jgi:hypothetical protein
MRLWFGIFGLFEGKKIRAGYLPPDRSDAQSNVSCGILSFFYHALNYFPLEFPCILVVRDR